MFFRRKINFSFLILGGIALIAAILFLGWLRMGMYSPKNINDKSVITLSIKKGEGVTSIGADLENKGLIKNKFFFQIYVSTKGIAKKLKAGDYSFSPSMSVSEIANKIAGGEIEKKDIKIVDGWNLRDIAWLLEGQEVIKAENFYKLAGFPAADFTKLTQPEIVGEFVKKYDFFSDKPETAGLEGYLYPDTYEISASDSAEVLLEKILDNFGAKLDAKLRKEIASQKKSIFEVITMASLIEKEANNLKDKKEVSGILWKRLAIGMPLQVDATVGYITQNKTINITRAELASDSPYNTYKFKGLPIGPICSPGLDSIKAAIYPTQNDYWYYLSTKSGQMIYSRTYEEHLIAKAKYLR